MSGGPKFEKTEREGVLAKVAQMEARGYNQFDIAREVGVSQGQVSEYLKLIRKRYRESMEASVQELVLQKRRQYEELRKELFAAWERSKLDSEKHTEERALLKKLDTVTGGGVGAKGKQARKPAEREMRKVRETIVREGRLPATEYLRLIELTYKAEREMLGLDEAAKVDITARVVNWDTLVVVPDGKPKKIADLEEFERQALGPARPKTGSEGNGNGNGTSKGTHH